MCSHPSSKLIAILIAINAVCSVVESRSENDITSSAESLFIMRFDILVRWATIATISMWLSSRVGKTNRTTWLIPVLLFNIIAATSRLDFYVNYPWDGWYTQWEWLSDFPELGLSIFWHQFVAHLLAAIIVSQLVLRICNIALVPKTETVIEKRCVTIRSLILLTTLTAMYFAINNADRLNTLKEHSLKTDFAMRVDQFDIEHGVVFPVIVLQMVNAFTFAMSTTLFVGNRTLRLVGGTMLAILLCIRGGISIYSSLAVVPRMVSESMIPPTLVPTVGQFLTIDLLHVILPIVVAWIMQSTGYRWERGHSSTWQLHAQKTDEQSDGHQAADRPL